MCVCVGLEMVQRNNNNKKTSTLMENWKRQTQTYDKAFLNISTPTYEMAFMLCRQQQQPHCRFHTFHAGMTFE